MRLAIPLAALAGATIATGADARPPRETATATHAPRPAPPVAPAWTRPSPTLPMLASVGRVKVDATRDRIVVVEDIDLPKGDWQSGGLDLFAAFGAPGTPTAVEARLVTARPGDRGEADPRPADDARPLEIEHRDPGVRLAVVPSPHRAGSAIAVLGKPQMAGVVIRVPEATLRRAFSESDRVVVRIRSLLTASSADATGSRDVVVRLGLSGGLPMTLGRIQVASADGPISRAEANLCGPEADPWPLAIAGAPRTRGADRRAPIAPSAAVRHASDDLCIRWWAR